MASRSPRRVLARSVLVPIALTLGCGGGATTAPTPPPPPPPAIPAIGLNHLYVVVDADSFAVFRDHPYFRTRFAAVDTGLPRFAAPTASSQSLYFRGRQTYLEVFGPDNKFGEPVGKVGLAWSVDRADALDALVAPLTGAGGPVERALPRWDFDTDRPVDWYHVLYRDAPDEPRLVWWFSEYARGFLAALFPTRGLAADDVTRASFLAARFDPTRDLDDVVGLALEVSPEDHRRLTADLAALGYAATARADGGHDLRGPDVEVTVSPTTAPAPRGLRALALRGRATSPGPAVATPTVALTWDATGRGTLALGAEAATAP